MNATELIDQKIASLPDWRGKLLSQLRQLIHEADPDIQEAWKWNTAVFVHGTNVCAIGAFKDHVKLNFFKGATLVDPHGLINAGLESKVLRAVDFYESDSINPKLKELIEEAVAQTKKV